MLDYFLTEEEKMIRDLAFKIAKEKIAPVAEKYDRENTFAKEVLDEIFKADLAAIYIPEEYGGFGSSLFSLILAIEQLSWGCLGISTSFAATYLGAFPIILFGTKEQKEKYLPKIATGEFLAAFALTEPQAGSDATALTTTAKKDGNYYILNGLKQWITNGGEADIYTVIAVTDESKGARGYSAFIVEKGLDGFTFGKKEDKMGIRASVTRELIFDNVKIAKENLIGKEGWGFKIALSTLNLARPAVGAQAVGLAQRALDEAAKFALERKQFSKPVATFQAVSHILADMATEIEAARALVYSIARHIDKHKNGNFSKFSSMAKLFASDVAMKVSIDAIQVMGGNGYMKDFPVEKLMRDAKILQIYEGTNQIQRNEIAQALLKEYRKKRK